MSKQTVVIVHGMGSTTKQEFEDNFVLSCENAFNLYDKLKGKNVRESFNIETFDYNEIFEGVRKKMTSGSPTIKDFVSSNKNGATAKALPGFVDSIDGIYDFISDDNIFSTHWLDVLIYRTTLFAEDVRVHFAKFLCDVIERKGDGTGDVHIVAHSLGTAVVHDTLAKLYVDDFPFKRKLDIEVPRKLNLDGYRLSSVHLFANVSRVLESFVDVDESVVKPGSGCTQYLNQYLNVLDPIPRVKAFHPSRTDGWVSPDVWSRRYRRVETSSITAGNPHSLSHYLLDPENSYELFYHILPDAALTKEDQKFAQEKFDALTLEAKTKKLKLEFRNLDLSDRAGFKDLLNAMSDLKNFLDGIGEEWRN